MTKKSKEYLFLTIVGITLVFFGAWGSNLGGKLNSILGVILFVIPGRSMVQETKNSPKDHV